MNEPIIPEEQQFNQFLAKVWPTGWGTVWSLPAKQSAWVPSGEYIAGFAGGRDLYFGVNPILAKGTPTQRGTNDTVAAVAVLYADLDAKSHGDLDAHVTGLPLPPSMVIDSGGGRHAYWLLAEPVATTDEHTRQRMAALQKRWALHVGGDPGAVDLARVLRVPGTVNTKYDPPRPVRILSCDLGRVYTCAQFEDAMGGPLLAAGAAENEHRTQQQPPASDTATARPAAAVGLLEDSEAIRRALSVPVFAKTYNGVSAEEFAGRWERLPLGAGVHHDDGRVKTCLDIRFHRVPISGVYEAYGGDESAADYEQAGVLCACCHDGHGRVDIDQVERIMTATDWLGRPLNALYRDKWSRADYLRRTIERAARDRREFYDLDECRDLADVEAEYDETRTNTGAAGTGFRPVTAAALASREFPPQVWLAPNLLPIPALVILAGKKKSKKSFLCLSACADLAEGRGVMGLPSTSGPVETLYFALEDSAQRIQDRLGYFGTAPAGLHILTRDAIDPRLLRDYNAFTVELDAYLEQHPRVKLVVIDTLERVRPSRKAGADPYAESTKVHDRLQDIAMRRGVALIVVAHCRKSESETDVFDDILGDQGGPGVADVLMVLKADKGGRTATLHVTGRDTESESRDLEFGDDCRWRVKPEEKPRRDLTATQQAIVDAVKSTGPLSVKGIGAATGLPEGTVKSTTNRLTKYGILTHRESRFQLTH